MVVLSVGGNIRFPIQKLFKKQVPALAPRPRRTFNRESQYYVEPEFEVEGWNNEDDSSDERPSPTLSDDEDVTVDIAQVSEGSKMMQVAEEDPYLELLNDETPSLTDPGKESEVIRTIGESSAGNVTTSKPELPGEEPAQDAGTSSHLLQRRRQLRAGDGSEYVSFEKHGSNAADSARQPPPLPGEEKAESGRRVSEPARNPPLPARDVPLTRRSLPLPPNTREKASPSHVLLSPTASISSVSSVGSNYSARSDGGYVNSSSSSAPRNSRQPPPLPGEEPLEESRRSSRIPPPLPGEEGNENGFNSPPPLPPRGVSPAPRRSLPLPPTPQSRTQSPSPYPLSPTTSIHSTSSGGSTYSYKSQR